MVNPFRLILFHTPPLISLSFNLHNIATHFSKLLPDQLQLVRCLIR